MSKNGALPCRCEILTIAEPYGCGDMQFCPNEKSKRGILKKYSITGKQCGEICSMLENKLAVGIVWEVYMKHIFTCNKCDKEYPCRLEFEGSFIREPTA